MEKKLQLESVQNAITLFGNRDENINYLRSLLEVEISLFDDILKIIGQDDKVERASKIIEILLSKASSNVINKTFVNLIAELVDNDSIDQLDDVLQPIATNIKGKVIKCKSLGQYEYVKAINSNSIVFGIGPAGTGKTYLAVTLAVNAFKSKQVEKIILTRPAVEAGEKLGFLPGDLGAKVDPYLRPLFDALQEMFGLEAYAKLIEKGAIEIAPLAYMRGRTLSNAFIILDEAQNTTREQMKMFLTRMGEGSKIVVTGDVTQIDLPTDKASGLVQVSQILQGIKDIKIMHLTSKDIVRHDLVQRIVDAYEKNNKPNVEKYDNR